MTDFVHLHNHTHYSLRDAVPSPKELVDAAVADGHPAVALTDHGVMHGIIEFYNAAKYAGIKPLVGMEGYIANGSRFQKGVQIDGKKQRNYFHIILIAKNQTGYKNLVKLTSLGHTEGFYYRPRIDKELLEKYHEGLICTSACMGSMINAHILNDDLEKAYSEAQYYRDMFGEDFYIEIQNHNLEDDWKVLKHAPEIAKHIGAKLIATNDIHYMKKEDAVAHNILLNISDVSASNGNNFNPRELRYRVPEFYFKTYAEMRELFADYPEALSNTLEIADKCDFELDTSLAMPQFPIPAESKARDLDEYLEELTWRGIHRKYGEITESIRERAVYELGVIKNMGFPGYFLIVWDFIRAAKELGVSVGPGRGSAAGSLIAYALDITNVDPLKYDLLFERFLNPERVSMPDIDIDFNDQKRYLVIEYVKKKYGEDAVAQIVTFGKLSSKAVLTDVGRVLGVELNRVKDITKKIPVFRGKVFEIKKALEQPDLKWLKETDDPLLNEVINYSLVLENKNRHTGIHAAGVVIAPGEITNYVPIIKPQGKSAEDSTELITQYSMTDLEQAGLLKMDFLGLKTLSIIDDTLEMVERNTGEKIDIDKIDFNDKKTYDMISKGDTLAVFQFESDGMREYLKRLKPQNLEEITAMNALYRPGPMENIPDFIDRKFGRKKIEYLHPIMESVLRNTYGIIVYQEQVMQLVQVIADFTLGQADILRRAMGKKKVKEMDKMKPLFIEGAANHGISEALAIEIFNLIYKFADYGFNKSHSLAYSYLAYQTAYLKAHYPAEFLAANMTAEMNERSKIVELIEEAAKFDIKLQPPDVNRSFSNFTAQGKTIFFGLAGIKNVGVGAVDLIVESRKEKKFTSFFDFAARADTKAINKRALEALVCSGAFDTIHNGKRRVLWDSIETALIYSKAVKESQNSMQDSLFGGDQSELPEPRLPEVEEWQPKEKLEREYEYLEFYVSGHPLMEFYPFVKSLGTFRFGDETPDRKDSFVWLCGLVTEIRKRRDKKDKEIAFAKVEDLTGKGECIFWSNTFDKYRDLLSENEVFLFGGQLSASDDSPKIVIDEMLTLEEAVPRFAKGLKLLIDIDNRDHQVYINDMKENFCKEHKTSRVEFYLSNQDKSVEKHYIAHEVPIKLDFGTVTTLAKWFGNSNVRISVL